MNRKKIIIITIICIILFIIGGVIYTHIYNYNYIAKDIEILQIGNIDKTSLEDLARTNNPIVLNKLSEIPEFNPNKIMDQQILISNYFPLNKNTEKIYVSTFLDKFNKLPISTFELKMNKDVISEKFLSLLQQYHNPLAYNLKSYIHFIDSSFIRNPTSIKSSRNIYIILEGEVYFHLYHPKHKKNIKWIKNIHNEFEVSFYNENHNSFSKCNYTKIIVRKNQGIIIPRYWMYTWSTPDKAILLNQRSYELMFIF